MRHFTNLSHVNYGIETGFYPLGSCTMKYNPKINERTAGHVGFTHPPHAARGHGPGALEILDGVQEVLKSITASTQSPFNRWRAPTAR
ncbi:MAG: hypothetical protein U0S12_07125 [Fimbriimonadales bacterium]